MKKKANVLASAKNWSNIASMTIPSRQPKPQGSRKPRKLSYQRTLDYKRWQGRQGVVETLIKYDKNTIKVGGAKLSQPGERSEAGVG